MRAGPDESVAAFEALDRPVPRHRAPACTPGSGSGTCSEEKGDPSRAIASYQASPAGPWMERARQRVEILRTPALGVVTPRTFRAAESPHLRITTRNLARLSFAAYKLDPEAYFRKKQALSGVEALDVGLVAPDAEWSEPVPGYARYKQVEASYELKKLEGLGFWAVKVTDEATLRATTMVLRSDLEGRRQGVA